MSSHHIVREKQEPALLLLGLDGFGHEQLGQLLEWSPTVIATGQTAETLNSMGIKIDWIITDNPVEPAQSDVKEILAGHGAEIESALAFLIVNSYPAVNIIADNFELKHYEPYVDKINMVIFNDRKKIYAINSGFSKWKSSGELIQILNGAADVQFTGLEITDGQLHKTTNDGFFSLHFNRPFLFIAEEL